MKRLRLGAILLAVAAVMLGAVWFLAAPSGPPLYDGLGLPPEPYRYLDPPANLAKNNLLPTAAHRVIHVSRGKFPLTVVQTGERPPQAQLILEDNSLRVSPSVSGLTATIRAVHASSLPSGGVLASNVYEMSVKPNSGASVGVKKALVSVALRGTGTHPTLSMGQYAGGQWVRLPTAKYLGQSTYVADITSFGDFALFTGGKPSTGSGVPAWLYFVLIAVLVVAVAVVAIGLVRLNRERLQDEGSA